MEETLIILLQSGVGVISNYPEDYDIGSYLGAVVKNSADGSFVAVSGNKDSINLPLDVVDHLLDTSPIIYLYSSITHDGIANYIGSINISRESIIESRAWCKAYKEITAGSVI